MSESKHKNCPFCGGEPEYDNSDDGPYEWIQCTECGAQGPTMNYNLHGLGDAWTFWDVRADPPDEEMAEAESPTSALPPP